MRYLVTQYHIYDMYIVDENIIISAKKQRIPIIGETIVPIYF